MSFEVIINSQIQVFANFAAFPATGLVKTIYIAKDNSSAYYWNDTATSYELLGGAPASVVWGAITGNIADQTDLINLLDDKVPYTGATGNVDLGEYQIKAGQVELDQTPTGTFGVGKMRWNDTDGTAEIRLKGNNVTLQIGQEQVKRVVNKTSPSITLQEIAYQAVVISGAQGQRLAVKLAKGDSDANSAGTIGIVTETIAANQEGFITTSGEVRGINTTGSLQGETWADGDILYLSPTTFGALTNIKPIAPNHLVVIGYVEYAHAVNGKIFVKVDNGYELEELHNVTDTNYTTPQDVDSVLILDDATSLWKRLTWANIKSTLKTYFDTLYQAVLVSGTNIKTINSTSLLGSGDVSVQPTLVSGTNIKTINGSSVLGSGDLVVGGASGVHGFLTPIGMGVTAMVITSGTNTTVPAANTMYAYPIIMAKDYTFNSMQIYCQALLAGANARILIYSDLNSAPNTKLYESTTIDLSTTGTKTITNTMTFTKGTIYWMVLHCGNGGAPLLIRSMSSLTTMPIGYQSNNATYNLISKTSVPLGSAPTTFGASSVSTLNAPLIALFQ